MRQPREPVVPHLRGVIVRVGRLAQHPEAAVPRRGGLDHAIRRVLCVPAAVRRTGGAIDRDAFRLGQLSVGRVIRHLRVAEAVAWVGRDVRARARRERVAPGVVRRRRPKHLVCRGIASRAVGVTCKRRQRADAREICVGLRQDQVAVRRVVRVGRPAPLRDRREELVVSRHVAALGAPDPVPTGEQLNRGVRDDVFVVIGGAEVLVVMRPRAVCWSTLPRLSTASVVPRTCV